MRSRRWRAVAGPLVVCAAVVLANLLYLTGVFSDDPLIQYGGVTSALAPGPLPGSNSIDPNNGFSTQALGGASVHALLHHQSPWWNYDEQVGAPLAGEMQGATFFLPFVLLLALRNGILLLHVALELVAGVATWGLLRKLGCRQVSCAAGGILFGLNGTFAWLGNAVVNPIPFLPVVLLGVEGLYQGFRQEGRWTRWWVVAAAGLAFSVYAGFPETAFLDACLIGAWVVVRAFQLRERRAWLRFLAGNGLAAGVGLLLAAPILAAFAAYLPYADVGIHAAVPAAATLPPASFPALVMPYLFGPIFGFHAYDHTGALASFWGNTGGYLSTGVVLLAILGLLAGRRERLLTLVLAGWLVVAIGRAYGLPGVAQVLNLIPGMSTVAAYRYIQPSMELAAVVLAAVALDRLHEPAAWKPLTLATGLAVAVLCGVALYGRGLEHELAAAPHHATWLSLSLVWAFAIPVAILLARFAGARWGPVLVVVVLAADALALFVVPEFSAPRSGAVDTRPVAFLQANLGLQRFYSLGQITPNYTAYYGVASINSNNMPITKSWSAYVPSHLDPNTSAFTFVGNGLIDPQGITPLQAFVENVGAYEELGVTYLVAAQGQVPAVSATAVGLTPVFSTPRVEIFQLPAPKPYFEVVGGGCTVAPTSKSRVVLDCTGPATLVRREAYLPGWRATANGRTVTVGRSGPLFEQVDLPPGRSEVAFDYRPRGLGLSLVALLIGVLAVAGGLCAPPLRRLVRRGSRETNGS